MTWNISVTNDHVYVTNDMEYLCHKWHGISLSQMTWNIPVTNDHVYVPFVLITIWSFPHSWLITEFVARVTWWIPHVEQELPTLLEHLSSPPVFSGARVTRSLVLCVCFVDRCLCFFFCSLCCLFYFNLQLLITPLVSLNFSLY
jgi:hypothetical protein